MLVLFALASVLWWSAPAQAQEEVAPGRDTDYTFTIGKVIGQPGTEVGLSVLFGRKAQAANAAQVRARVRYPGAVLKFARMEDAYLSKRAKLHVEAKESQGSGAETVLDMNFTLPDPQSAFPSGQIATLYLTVAADATDQVIHLTPDAWMDEKQILPNSPDAQIEPGEVRISATPVMVGCFFFTH